jgi:hypothetical protein
MTEGTTVTVPVPPDAVARVYSTRATTIEPHQKKVLFLIPICTLIAIKGFVWTSPKGPLGPTFSLPLEDPAHEGQIQVEILLGKVDVPAAPTVFVSDPDSRARLETIADTEGTTWMVAAESSAESLAHNPKTEYRPIETALQVSVANASDVPLELPMSGLFLLCIPMPHDEDCPSVPSSEPA